MTIYTNAEPKDIPILTSLLQSVRGDTKDLDYQKFVVAKDDNNIIGCVRIKELSDCSELASVAVLPEYRGQGIGLELVRRMLKQETARPIYLLCFAETCDFYIKAGFIEVPINTLPNSLQQECDRVAVLLKDSGRRISAMAIN